MSTERAPETLPAWPRSLDPALVARLERPLVRPGIVSLALVRRILGWMDYFAGRSSLVGELARRRGQTGTRGDDQLPIVHAVWALRPEAATGAAAMPQGATARETVVERAAPRTADPVTTGLPSTPQHVVVHELDRGETATSRDGGEVAAHGPQPVVAPLQVERAAHDPRPVVAPLQVERAAHDPRPVVAPLQIERAAHDPRPERTPVRSLAEETGRVEIVHREAPEEAPARAHAAAAEQPPVMAARAASPATGAETPVLPRNPPVAGGLPVVVASGTLGAGRAETATTLGREAPEEAPARAHAAAAEQPPVVVVARAVVLAREEETPRSPAADRRPAVVSSPGAGAPSLAERTAARASPEERRLARTAMYVQREEERALRGLAEAPGPAVILSAMARPGAEAPAPAPAPAREQGPMPVVVSPHVKRAAMPDVPPAQRGLPLVRPRASAPATLERDSRRRAAIEAATHDGSVAPAAPVAPRAERPLPTVTALPPAAAVPRALPSVTPSTSDPAASRTAAREPLPHVTARTGELPSAAEPSRSPHDPSGTAATPGAVAPPAAPRSAPAAGERLPAAPAALAAARPARGGDAVDVDALVDKVQRKLLRRLAAERERRGLG